MKKGFTLIELLVVVLIIGILSAIALPQYQKAVRKARIAEARINLRAIIDATDRYILENGNADDLELSNLDISVQSDTKNWSYSTGECVSEGSGLPGCRADAIPNSETPNYLILYYSKNYAAGYPEDPYAGHFYCWSDNTDGKKTCAALGKQTDPEEFMID